MAIVFENVCLVTADLFIIYPSIPVRNSLSQQVRLYAALCHLAGFMWLVAAALLMFVFFSAGIFSLVLILIPGLVWLSTRKVHDFVDRAGREALSSPHR